MPYRQSFHIQSEPIMALKCRSCGKSECGDVPRALVRLFVSLYITFPPPSRLHSCPLFPTGRPYIVAAWISHETSSFICALCRGQALPPPRSTITTPSDEDSSFHSSWMIYAFLSIILYAHSLLISTYMMEPVSHNHHLKYLGEKEFLCKGIVTWSVIFLMPIVISHTFNSGTCTPWIPDGQTSLIAGNVSFDLPKSFSSTSLLLSQHPPHHLEVNLAMLSWEEQTGSEQNCSDDQRFPSSIYPVSLLRHNLIIEEKKGHPSTWWMGLSLGCDIHWACQLHSQLNTIYLWYCEPHQL